MGRTLLRQTVDIVAARLKGKAVGVEELPDLIRSVHVGLQQATGGEAERPSDPGRQPAVPINRSVTPDYIVCLEDGKRLKILKRHIWAKYGLTPEAYRLRWGLPGNYPMAAPGYREKRARMAVEQSFGRGNRRSPDAASAKRAAARP
jgi:predicted transcriptional regulator